jgi:hypothetical protein
MTGTLKEQVAAGHRERVSEQLSTKVRRSAERSIHSVKIFHGFLEIISKLRGGVSRDGFKAKVISRPM